MWHKVNFKQSSTGWNSEFSFSYMDWHTKVKKPSLPNYLSIPGGRIIGFIPFPTVHFSVVVIEKGAFGLPLTIAGQLAIYIYIYIYIYEYIYIYVCVCVCVYACTYIWISYGT